MGTGTEVVSRRFADLTTGELYDLLRLRCDVFVVEQSCAYPELDGRDTETGTVHHWVVGDDGRLQACLRTLAEPDGSVRIGRVATAPEARGRGIATDLMTSVLATIDGAVVLDAQTYLVGWYASLGFRVDGPEFVEDGIPHVPMRR